MDDLVVSGHIGRFAQKTNRGSTCGGSASSTKAEELKRAVSSFKASTGVGAFGFPL